MEILKSIGLIIGIVGGVGGFIGIGVTLGKMTEKLDNVVEIVPVVNQIGKDLATNNADTLHAQETACEALQMVTGLSNRVSRLEGECYATK